MWHMPNLVVIGKHLYLSAQQTNQFNTLSEKKVLPLSVLLCFVAYFSIALVFYFDLLSTMLDPHVVIFANVFLSRPFRPKYLLIFYKVNR